MIHISSHDQLLFVDTIKVYIIDLVAHDIGQLIINLKCIAKIVLNNAN
ncbi:hypothetical protein I600_3275 [Maribacter dokdonensis DSW-8]|nr:hypothetical protein I600_3275 [Maribacter dokdonensis DSW-8]